MKEDEIRPRKVFDEYLRLCEEDVRTYFAGAATEIGRCPACDGVGDVAFSKHGFTYEACPTCHTLYVNPRPVADAFARYYTESPSAKYWATTFYRETEAARREKLWKPKTRLIRDTMQGYGASDHAIVDVGGGYGLFAEEMAALWPRPIALIEPNPHLARACRDKGLHVIEKFLEHVEPVDLPEGPKTFVSFELFEHLHAPTVFLERLKALMAAGDLFVFTTLSGTGVDIQVLWEHSKSVSPPHHLNFLNPSSIRLLLERLGLETLSVTTPGKLDVDILRNHQSLITDRFWRTFMAMAGDAERQQWQDAIAASGWSSHMMVTCRKPEPV